MEAARHTYKRLPAEFCLLVGTAFQSLSPLRAVTSLGIRLHAVCRLPCSPCPDPPVVLATDFLWALLRTCYGPVPLSRFQPRGAPVSAVGRTFHLIQAVAGLLLFRASTAHRCAVGCPSPRRR